MMERTVLGFDQYGYRRYTVVIQMDQNGFQFEDGTVVVQMNRNGFQFEEVEKWSRAKF